MKVIQSFIAISAMNSAVIIVLYAVWPGFRDYLFREDGLIENLTAVIFFCSFYISMLSFFKKGKTQKSLLLIALVSLFGFLDEISFGERHFGLNMPRYDGVKFDAVHDSLYWGFSRACSAIEFELNELWVIMGVGLAILAACGLVFRGQLKVWISRIKFNQKMQLDFVFLFLIACAMLVDLEILDNEYLYYAEETCEMLAGIALLFCSLIRVNSGDELSVANSLTLQKVSDGLAVFTACMMATWIRFESGFIPVYYDPPPPYAQYVFGSLLISMIVLLIMDRMKTRGNPFSAHVFLAILTGLGAAIVIIFFSNAQPPPSRMVVGMLFIMIPVLIVITRCLLFRIVIRKDFPSKDETGYGW